MIAARLLLLLGLLVAPLAAEAQSGVGIPCVGMLRLGAPTDPADHSSVGAFLTGLQEAGYAQGKDVHVERRYAHGDLSRLPALARELAALQVAAIVTSNPYTTRAAREASNTVPIIVALDYETDPVASGWIASLARPSGTSRAFFSSSRDEWEAARALDSRVATTSQHHTPHHFPMLAGPPLVGTRSSTSASRACLAGAVPEQERSSWGRWVAADRQASLC
jgi:hypothetical protein